MKKKITKKLALSKETLRNLGSQELREVVCGMQQVTLYSCEAGRCDSFNWPCY